ncbi:hypothetical protein [uncultured Treponema sp.]|uniref:tetratricopeptide repeat protein n=1 Tax=uncultured Treponema sp. TaxID=162155 RepID=UPI0025F892AD|nr:hypothetical protein [uncultured Treponema sp.]
MLKKLFSFLFVLTVLSGSGVFFSVSAQNSASSANRRTAVRYLQLAKQFASEKLWNEADSNAKMGLAYDDKIADLWYLHAVSLMNLGEKKSKILPLVVTALTEAEWVDYNRDGARILYADILCTTRQFVQALAVLDSEPFIYSADAEYIRVKSYYCLGDEESVKKARSRIDAARRVYPADSRFAEAFYAHEYQILRRTSVVSDETRRLADAFALTVPLYKNAVKELEVYAAIFASDEKPVKSAKSGKNAKNESKKVRMLKAFNSKRFTSPLYAIEALKAGLLSEDAALDYFYKFSDEIVSVSLLEDFVSLIKSDEAKKEIAEYLNSYNGTLTFDTDGDLITNMTVLYKRGRPQTISYDENQDDENEWKADCDFGVPVTLVMAENALELEYSSWPYISAAKYRMENRHSDLHFTLIAETLAWTPFSIESNSSIKKSLAAQFEELDSDFFVPVLLSDSANAAMANEISGQDLLRASLSYTIPSKEREGAVIQVSLLNGVAQLASYSVGEKIYAMAQFEGGIPVSRKVDIDGDGLFETSEVYGYSPEAVENRSTNFISVNDEMQIMTNLFGAPAQGTGFYVKKISVDRNGDTIPDFTEEYLSATLGAKIPGKISSWDTDGDGRWDVQYIKRPSDSDGVLREVAKFHQPLTDSLVTIDSENGIPMSVQILSSDESTSRNLPVIKGSYANFFWIGEKSAQNEEMQAEIEENIIANINQIGEQGVSTIVESEGVNSKRFLAVRIEKMIFGMEIPEN